ncbi:MAG: crossover junction endodeoxyribonuclease RuvC [Chitinophagaceae bacterium]
MSIPPKSKSPLAEPSKIILGVDPGSVVMGYAILQVTAQKPIMVEMDTISLNGKSDMYDRLGAIYRLMSGILTRHRPAELAIEAPFFGKNVQSMLKLGRAQGVVIAAAMMHDIPVTEYSPRRIKQVVTGNGNAPKEKVWEMLQHTLDLKELETPRLDASDALAVALCHHFESNTPIGREQVPKKKGGKEGWGDFIRQHPDRIG